MYLKNRIIFFFYFFISFCLLFFPFHFLHIRLFRFAFVGFVSFRFHFVDFVSFRFVFVDFVSFRFYFVSHFIGTRRSKRGRVDLLLNLDLISEFFFQQTPLRVVQANFWYHTQYIGSSWSIYFDTIFLSFPKKTS